MMNKQQKEALVADLKQRFNESEAIFLVGYKGLKVSSLQNLRKTLRAQGGTFKVSKATLMRIATKDVSGAQDFANDFENQIGLVFARDISGVAKSLAEFAKENAALKIISGFYEAKKLDKNQVGFIATLPSRNALIAQLAGTLQAPIVGLACQLNQLITKLAYALKQVEEQKQINN
jgi:large subunit ribosomal protein L10